MINCNFIPLKKNADKACHFMAGLIIAIVFSLLFTPVTGVFAGVFAGIAKEIYDEFTYGGFDFWDLFATVSGSALGAVLVDIALKYSGLL